MQNACFCTDAICVCDNNLSSNLALHLEQTTSLDHDRQAVRTIQCVSVKLLKQT